MSDRIHAPWTEQQIAALNGVQRSGVMPPFTCGGVHDMHQTLYAERDGWHCPDEDCDYRQEWAHAFMATPAAVTPPPWPQPPDSPLAAELKRVRRELRETQDQLGAARQRAAELTARLNALQIREAIRRIPEPTPPACGEILNGQTINDVPTTGSIL